MGKTNYSFTLSDETMSKLTRYADDECWSKSLAVETILRKFFSKKLVEYVKKKPEPIEPMTEEARIADWEWRKEQVLKGHLPVRFVEEYPNPFEPADGDKFYDPNKEEEPMSIGEAVMNKLKSS
jgi:hypothetical protein